jgi:DNA polymerase III delta prime subunit
MLPQKSRYRPPLPETASLPWVEKYRPKKTSDLISQDNIRETIQSFIQNDSVPNLLFYGPPGTGKTSLALAIAAQIYATEKNEPSKTAKVGDDVVMSVEPGHAFPVHKEQDNSRAATKEPSMENVFSRNNKQNILELNASDERGIEVVRERIVNFASTKKSAR